MAELFRFDVGDTVRKTHGYLWPGRVVITYHTVDGAARYIVVNRLSRGSTHIFRAQDLERDHRLFTEIIREASDALMDEWEAFNG